MLSRPSPPQPPLLPLWLPQPYTVSLSILQPHTSLPSRFQSSLLSFSSLIQFQIIADFYGRDFITKRIY